MPGSTSQVPEESTLAASDPRKPKPMPLPYIPTLNPSDDTEKTQKRLVQGKKR